MKDLFKQCGDLIQTKVCLSKYIRLSSPPVIFLAGRPKAALLFWFFGAFRCGALLFVVIHVIYNYKNIK